MRINEMANNIQKNTGTGVNSDLSLFEGAGIQTKDKATALFNVEKSAVGFFNTEEKKQVSGAGKAVYTLNEARGFDIKKEGMGEKILDSLNGTKDKNSELVKNLTGDDYDILSEEGTSPEKLGKERLEKAIERIKENREIREVRLSESVEKLQEYEESIEKMAINVQADTAAQKMIARLLYEADIPVTRENIEEVQTAVDKAKDSIPLSDSSENYLIKNNLQPTVGNIYKASHSGEMRLMKIDENAWESIKEKALEISNEAGLDPSTGLANSRWLVEHDLPVTSENLKYKTELDSLKDKDSLNEEELQKAVTDAIKSGKSSDEGLVIDKNSETEEKIRKEIESVIEKLPLIRDEAIRMTVSTVSNEDEISIENLLKASGLGSNGEPGVLSGSIKQADTFGMPEGAIAPVFVDSSSAFTVREVTVKIRLEEVRLSLNLEAGRRLMANGINILSDSLMHVAEGIREMEKEYFKDLFKEIGLDSNDIKDLIDEDEAAELAVKTKNSLSDISNSPLGLYKATFSIRHTVTLSELSESAGKLIAVPRENGDSISVNPSSMKTVLATYESSATEVRKDLGDSIRKAFAGSVDSLLSSNGMELSEANRRAVRILGYNSMEITVESVENMKYYDAKVTGLIEKMTPPVVMAMIRDGINPLESTIDELDMRVTDLLRKQGATPEQKYSEFLVRMEETHSITENERNAYIGIYRLLYNVEKNDGAAVGSLLHSGRELNFRNLMTEVRSMTSSVDFIADDDNDIKNSYYKNSVTAQIDEAFIYQRRLIEDSLDVTEPEAWDTALSGNEYMAVTIEQLNEGLHSADGSENNMTDLNLSSSVKADELVRTMTNNTPISRMLNSFGIRDSFENRRSAEDLISNPEKEGSAFEVSTEELIDALDSGSGFDELLGIKTRMANALVGQAFSTAVNAQSAAELNSRVERIEMIRELAGKGHYRLNVEGEEPKKVEMTLIRNSGNSGTVSVRISKEAYNLQADMGMVIMDSRYDSPSVNRASIHFDGKVPENAYTLADDFKESLKNEGIIADNINIASGIPDEEAYLSSIARQKEAADPGTGLENADAMFRTVKSLLSVF